MTATQPPTTEGLPPIDEADRWWRRHVTPLLARWERDFGQQPPAPAAPVPQAVRAAAGVDPPDVPMLPIAAYGPDVAD